MTILTRPIEEPSAAEIAAADEAYWHAADCLAGGTIECMTAALRAAAEIRARAVDEWVRNDKSD